MISSAASIYLLFVLCINCCKVFNCSTIDFNFTFASLKAFSFPPSLLANVVPFRAVPSTCTGSHVLRLTTQFLSLVDASRHGPTYCSAPAPFTPFFPSLAALGEGHAPLLRAWFRFGLCQRSFYASPSWFCPVLSVSPRPIFYLSASAASSSSVIIFTFCPQLQIFAAKCKYNTRHARDFPTSSSESSP